MRNNSYVTVLTIVVATIAIDLVDNSSLIPSVNAQGAGDAYFTGVEYSLKIYQWTQDKWNFTVYNANCEVDIFGRAWFFFKFYLDDSLWWDEYQEAGTWQLDKGSSTTRTYTMSLGSGPATKNAKIELFWDYEGTPYLQDTIYFSEKIVKLFVEELAPLSLTVEKGKTTASTLSISFKNGGNDDMYSAEIAITDSAGLEITPQSQTLEDIASGGTKSTSFSVTAPITATLGTHTVSFEISYSDFRNVSHTETKTASVDVSKLGTNIALSVLPSSLKIGASTTITAKLTDGNTVALADEEISFSIEELSLGTATTDSSGNAVKTYTANLDAGTYDVKVSYAGSSDYGSSDARSNLIVNPLDTTLTIDAPSVKTKEIALISTTLEDENGNPISGENIDCYLYEDDEWKKINTTTITDGAGKAVISKAFDTAGDYQIKAGYAGSANYNNVNATVTLTISQYTTALTFDVPSATQGKECTLKATLKDEEGSPLQNIVVDFYIYEENDWNEIGSAKTDSNGVASLIYTPSTTGTFQVKAMFGGATNYADSSSTPSSLNVVMDYTLFYIGGGIIAVAIIGIVGYLVFRKRKTLQSPE
ncbi:MAG: Ig-like domain repeat protein [Candidatus Bathyarchaeota archaeon]|nr:MAG: Ig-like domain repeat protein [Candidatus Bathyarchaeota archaeon]